jgi:hypothetical protein
MNSRDWADMARVYRAGAMRYARYGIPTSGPLHADALNVQADECEAISRERARLERLNRSER